MSGLARGTTYHYRVVATNYCNPEAPEEECTTHGSDQTFTTSFIKRSTKAVPTAHVRQQTGAALLLDCRAYELVSASNTGGYDVESDLSEGAERRSVAIPKPRARQVLYASTTAASPGPTTRPTAAPIPTSRPAAKTAGHRIRRHPGQ